MIVLRPHDVVVLLRLQAGGAAPFASFADIAAGTGLSVGEVHKSLKRSEVAGLYTAAGRRPSREALREFLFHGVRYAFPAVRGPLARGVPTSVAALPLSDAFSGAALPPEFTPVWPSAEGTRRGYSVEPLYRTLPAVAPLDPTFYELLALTDALREGRARERGAAQHALLERLFP